MSSHPTIWMGLGIFERLYSDKKIERYFRELDALPNPKVFILADEITGTNTFVLSGKKYDREKDRELLLKHQNRAHEKFLPKYAFIQSLITTSAHPELWRVEYWDYLSTSKEYQHLLESLYTTLEQFEHYHLKKEVLRVTIFGFGARLRKNFTTSFIDFVFDKDFYRYLETLSAYTVEEVAAIIHLSKKGWIKAGHEDEQPFDTLSELFYQYLNKSVLKLEKQPKFLYL